MHMNFIVQVLIILVISLPVNAGNNLTEFPLSNEKCATVGDITVGQNGRWTHCHVTKTSWFATIGFLDLYQTQYCLGNKAKTCDQKAQLLFSNRAYTPNARLILQRIDTGDIEYDLPILVDTGQGLIMVQATHTSKATTSSGQVRSTTDTVNYFLWQSDFWQPIDAQAWRSELPNHLPAGTSVKAKLWPDIKTMSAQARLYREGDADCCPKGGVADIKLKLIKSKFSVKSVKVSHLAK